MDINECTILINEEDFFEDRNYNLTVMNGGVGSFNNSQLLSGISYIAMREFG